MKIKLMVSEQRYAEIFRELTEKGIEIDNDAELCLTEKSGFVSFLIGRRGEEMFRLETVDISHIESFGHDVFAYVNGEEYKLGERLFKLCSLLDNSDFLRVSNSAIVSVSHIKSIRPALSQKFVLTMKDGSRVDVTRSYYYIFKEKLGL